MNTVWRQSGRLEGPQFGHVLLAKEQDVAVFRTIPSRSFP